MSMTFQNKSTAKFFFFYISIFGANPSFGKPKALVLIPWPPPQRMRTWGQSADRGPFCRTPIQDCWRPESVLRLHQLHQRSIIVLRSGCRQENGVPVPSQRARIKWAASGACVSHSLTPRAAASAGSPQTHMIVRWKQYRERVCRGALRSAGLLLFINRAARSPEERRLCFLLTARGSHL